MNEALTRTSAELEQEMLDTRIQRLERRFRALALYAAGLTLVLVIGGLSAFRSESGKDQVLRARGIIIVDAAGRERILIGAPIPASKGRVRTDLAKVEKLWGGRYPSSAQYMGYYKNYRHSVNGMVVMDESGFDRLAIGDSVPDPNIGRRIGSSTGLVINNSQGDERTGYGLLDVKGIYRVVLGLDSKRGQEGVALVLDDAGRVGMEVRDSAGSAWLGTLQDQGAPSDFGLTIGGGKETKHRLTVGKP